MKSTTGKDSAAQPARQRWERPTIEKVGTVGEVLQGGGGKLSLVGGDPGDGRKQSGTDGSS